MAPFDAPVVVIGATRVLRPLTIRLVTAGTPVLAVARSAQALATLRTELGPGLVPVPVDAHVPGIGEALTRAADGRTPAAAVAYGPAIEESNLMFLESSVAMGDGPVVQLLTSGVAAPRDDEAEGAAWSSDQLPGAARRRRLVLGWRADGGWHTPVEIAAAAYDLLLAPSDRDGLLGAVRPWADRP